MGLANKSVVLYQSIKIGSKWTFCPVDEDSSHFSDGPFYVSGYDGKTKQMEPVGRDPEQALRAVTLKRAGLAYVAAGGEINQQDKKKSLESAYRAARGQIKQPENNKCPESTGVGRPFLGNLLRRSRAPYLNECQLSKGLWRFVAPLLFVSPTGT